jgi:hypothetical protein
MSRRKGNEEATRVEDVPVLRSLGPTYEPKLHGRHAAVLVQVLTDSSDNPAKNIALSGHYGSGKSSVILGVQVGLTEKDVTWVNLSLSSLGIDDTKRARVLDDGSLAPLTNLIQKEIVKQLLYRKAPAEMPGSRYFRIDSFRAGSAALWATAVGVAFFVVASLLGLVKRVQKVGPREFVMSHDWVPWVVVASFGVFVAGIWFLGLRALQSRLSVESLSAGGASVKLSAKENSYFDDYLDEIVYFFQRTKTQVAIFEDLDRFKDPHIFETLRELNTVLNNSEQIKARPVRFVYAVRDSIFEQLERTSAGDDEGEDGDVVLPASRLEVAPAANRTKFFDLVVPMVPFLTHRSARDLVAEEFAESEQRPSGALVNLVGANLTDMRLIRNIRNEFEIYRASILGKNGLKGLTADRLFAMMVYKNLHLEDFEAIRHGASKIDEAHRAFRDLVKHQTTHQAAVSKRALDQVAAAGLINARAKAAGDRLVKTLLMLHQVSGRPGQPVLVLGGTNYDMAALSEISFWEDVFETRDGAQLVAPRYGSTIALPFDDLLFIAGEGAANLEANLKADAAHLERSSRVALETKDFVSRATMAELMARLDLKMPFDGVDRNLDEIVAGLVSPVARELIANGYIDENFTLYCSDYHAIAISVSAMNFILHCVQPNVADYLFRFDEVASIRAVEKESGNRFLDGESVLNIEVFDHYLAVDPAKLEKAFAKLVARVGEDSSFVDAYVTDGVESRKFVKAMTPHWLGVFVHLIEKAPVADADLLALVDAAVASAVRTVDYATTAHVSEFISENYPRMSAFTSEVNAEEAANVGMLLRRLDVEIDVLADLGDAQRAAVVTAGLYSLTRPNLASAIGATAGIALDELISANEDVYKHVLGNLHDYLEVLAEVECAVVDPGEFAAVLSDVFVAEPGLLHAVAERASEECEIEDVDLLDEGAWAELVASERFAPTARNLSRLVGVLGVTKNLARYLEAHDLSDPNEVEVDARVSVGYALVETEHLTEQDAVRLVEQLDLPSGLAPDQLGENGLAMVPALLGAGLVPDAAATYSCISGSSFSLRENYFAVSKRLETYVTELPLSNDDLVKLMKSRRVALGAKRAIVEDLEFVRERLTVATAIAICEWADKGQSVSVPLLVELSQAGAPPDRVLSLLEPHLNDIDLGDLDQVLLGLGDEFEPLTRQGGQRPKLKDREGTEALLKELVKRGRVSTFNAGLFGGFRVNMRH